MKFFIRHEPFITHRTCDPSPHGGVPPAGLPAAVLSGTPNADQIEGIRRSAAINTALLDLLASELREGMTFTIEPMINRFGREIFTDDDGWTVCTGDGLPSAQWESMFQITETGNEVSTC